MSTFNHNYNERVESVTCYQSISVFGFLSVRLLVLVLVLVLIVVLFVLLLIHLGNLREGRIFTKVTKKKKKQPSAFN